MASGKESDSVHKGHRQRMKQQLRENGLVGFNDHQILELLLFYGIANGDTNPIAHRLIERFGSFKGVLEADYDELCEVSGIGDNSALLITFVRMLTSKYLSEASFENSSRQFSNTDTLRKYFEAVYVGCKTETIYAVVLDDDLRFVKSTVFSEGTSDKVFVRPRAVADFVIRNRCNNVVIAHNHPNGSCMPSREDIAVTSELVSALRLLEVELLDHIIVGKDGSFSMRTSNHSARIWATESPSW